MILVIGGSGRLGRLVVDELAAQHEVRVLAPHATTAVPPMDGRADLVDGDVRDLAAVAAAARGVSCIVIASHGLASLERNGLTQIDEQGSRAVAAAARAAGCSIVLLSSASAAPDAALELDRVKWAAEQAVRGSGVTWTIVRATPFAQTWAMILTMSAGRSGHPGIIGRGDVARRFVDVRDVADVVARASTDEALRGRVLEVSGPDALTVSQLAAMVQEANAWSGSPRHLPVPVASAIARGLGVFRPDLGRMLSIGVTMNDPLPANEHGGDAPELIVGRPITAATMGGPSTAQIAREP